MIQKDKMDVFRQMLWIVILTLVTVGCCLAAERGLCGEGVSPLKDSVGREQLTCGGPRGGACPYGSYCTSNVCCPIPGLQPIAAQGDGSSSDTTGSNNGVDPDAQCPSMEGMVGACAQLCPQAGCPQGQLCCSNGCGTSCMDPVIVDPPAPQHPRCSIVNCNECGKGQMLLTDINGCALSSCICVDSGLCAGINCAENFVCNVVASGGCQGADCASPMCLAVCRLGVDHGPCQTGLYTRWHFDAYAGICKDFRYGGCGGNGNKFNTYDECKETCWSQNEQTSCKLGQPLRNDDGTTKNCLIPGGLCPRDGGYECVEAGNTADGDPQGICCTTQVEEKSGQCPPSSKRPCTPDEMGEDECKTDTDCQGELKCCSDVCNTKCKEPYDPLNPPDPELVCPALAPGMGGICVELCPQDGCPDGELCCSNGCGHVCKTGVRDICEYDLPLTDASGQELFCGRGPGRVTCPDDSSCNIHPTDVWAVCCPARPRICSEPMDSGDCEAAIRRWYYDAEERSCKQFTYGGCNGNDNNFESFDDCMYKCEPNVVIEPPPPHHHCDVTCPACAQGQMAVIDGDGCPAPSCQCVDTSDCQMECDGTEVCQMMEVWCVRAPCPPLSTCWDTCRMPVYAGPCKAAITRWYFDRQFEKCQEFTYGGCQSNENNFYTEEDCNRRCSDGIIEPPVRPWCDRKCSCPSGQEPVLDTQGCPLLSCDCAPSSQCQAVECEGEREVCHVVQVQCESAPCDPLPLCMDKCELPVWPGPCRGDEERWYFDADLGQCVTFRYSGCGGNENQFRSEEECNNACGTPDVCSLPMEIGPCRAAMPRWFYNSESGQCERFSYGGCRGNGNNFIEEEDCTASCKGRDSGKLGSCPALGDGECYDDTALGDQCVDHAQCPGSQLCCKQPCGTRCLEPEVFPPRNDDMPYVCPEVPEVDRRQCVLMGRPQETCRNDRDCTAPNMCCADGCGNFVCKEPLLDVCEVGGPLKNADGEQLCCGMCLPFTQCPDTHYCSAHPADWWAVCCQKVPPIPASKTCEVFGPCSTECDEDVQTYGQDGCRECYCADRPMCQGRECDRGQVCHIQCANARNCQPQCVDICGLPMDKGPCEAYMESWYYDSSDGICKKFGYGGCLGNENRFTSKQECLQRCQDGGEEVECPALACDPCDAGYEYMEGADRCMTCLCVRREETQTCEDKQCDRGETCMMVDTPCFPPGPCDKVPICIKNGPDPCELSRDPGPCDAVIPSYYYDVDHSQCLPFTYGGCGGNSNRFSSLAHCQRQCVGCPMMDCTYPCKSYEVYDFTQDGCPTCQCSDPYPCKNVQCSQGKACRMVQVQCFTTPCNPQPTCIDDPCAGKAVCEIGCTGNDVRTLDRYGCMLCSCHDPCKDAVCNDGYTCVKDGQYAVCVVDGTMPSSSSTMLPVSMVMMVAIAITQPYLTSLH